MTGQDGRSGSEPVGAQLKRLRRARRWSQLRLAEELCGASATPTVSRHEVSRWERGDRIPGAHWLGWLAVVLETPLDELEEAAVVTRGQSPDPGEHAPGLPWLWRPPGALDLLAALDRGTTHDPTGLAHAWLTGPPDDTRSPAPVLEPDLVDGTGRDIVGGLEARLGRLRRADDLIGGVELAALADRRLREAVTVLRRLGGGRLRRRALRLVAGSAQLTGWVHADAGAGLAARRAYRVALRAAAAAGDRELAAHVLGSLSSLSLGSGNAHEALLLARTGLAGLGGEGSALLRTLLLHRAALAAARYGERREADLALSEAERVADRAAPGRDPDWLYWLDGAELTAMTGWCLVVLGRPLRAVPLLERPRPGAGRRGCALYGCWFARCYADLGELEQACRIAQQARMAAEAAGSARAVAGLRHLHPVLLRHRDAAAVRRYAERVTRPAMTTQSVRHRR